MRFLQAMNTAQYWGAIASAIAGGLIFKWLTKKWSRRVPQRVGVKWRGRLLRENQSVLRLTRPLELAGFCAGGLFCASRWLRDNDARGLGLPLGLMCVLPLVWVALANTRGGTVAIKECLFAWAISENTPPGLFFGFVALCIVGGVISAIGLLARG
jgi:hypothetical protein